MDRRLEIPLKFYLLTPDYPRHSRATMEIYCICMYLYVLVWHSTLLDSMPACLTRLTHFYANPKTAETTQKNIRHRL